VTDELSVLGDLPRGADHGVVEQLLLVAGWVRCGVGDWAVVLASPSGRLAARVSPFDPVAPYSAELFRRAAGTRQVPVLHALVELEGGAVCTVMERLDPVPEERAARFFAALEARKPYVRDLATALDEVHAEAVATLPWCGPIDPNPSNVMARGDELVLTDPFFADGKNLYGSLEKDATVVARSIPPERRRHMFDLPLAESGPWDIEERERLRQALAEADRRLGARAPS
jgi:hypothetical protein